MALALRVLVALGDLIPEQSLPDGTLCFGLPRHSGLGREHRLNWHPDLAATWVQGTRFYVTWKLNPTLAPILVTGSSLATNNLDLEGLDLCSSELSDLLEWLANNRV